MTPFINPQFRRFLESDLAIPADAIALALRQNCHYPYQLSVVLWQHGLITLQQFDRIFDWLELV